jgi:hypothetical protein
LKIQVDPIAVRKGGLPAPWVASTCCLHC